MTWFRAIAAVSGASIVLAIAGCGGGDREEAPTPRSQVPAAGELGRNTVRIPGLSAGDVAGAALLAAYPPKRSKPPNGWILVPDDSWQDVVLGAQFAGRPVNGGLLVRKKDYFPPASLDLLKRMRPAGFPRGEGLQAIIIGKGAGDVLNDLQDQKLKLTEIKGKPAELALTLVPFRSGYAHQNTSNVMIVSSKERDYALPAAAWSAYTGDTIAFVDGDEVPKATEKLLTQRKKLRLETPSVYLMGPERVIPRSVEQELAQFGKVTRVGGDAQSPIDMAIALARFRDPATGFGWGLEEGKGPASVSVVNVKDWGHAIGALTFAGAGPQAALLLTDDPKSLPPQVVSYVKGLRSPVKPGQGFVFGNEKSVSSQALRQLDEALGTGP